MAFDQSKLSKRVQRLVKLIDKHDEPVKICKNFCKIVDLVKSSDGIFKINQDYWEKIDNFIKVKLNDESFLNEHENHPHHKTITDHLVFWNNLDDKIKKYVSFF